MKEDIIIQRKHLERFRTWAGRAIDSIAWLLCLGLLVVSVIVPAGAAVGWLVSGSETLLASGLLGGVVCGCAGVWLLVRRLDRAARGLRQTTGAA